jgi:hypothetical protein
MATNNVNPYAGKLLATPQTNSFYSQLNPASQGYIKAKLGYDLGNQEKLYGSDSAMWSINDILKAKGGQQVGDWGQVDTALQPLIAKRNKRGLGGILGMALPIGLSLLAPGIGTALGASLGIGATAGTALAGAGLGGLGGAVTGQNVLKSALMGGLSGGLQGATAGKVLAQSGPLTGSYVTPGANLTRALSGPLAGQIVSPSMGANIGTNIAGFNPNLIDRTISTVGRLGNQANNTLKSIGGSIGLGDIAGGGEMFNLGGGSFGGSSNPLVTALTGYMDYQNQADQEKKLRQAQMQAMNEFSPYRSSGVAANKRLSDALAAGFNPGDLESDPGYQFRLGEGRRGLEQSLAARGMGQSGTALKAAQEYGQNFAAKEYADAYNRWLENNRQNAAQAGVGFDSAKEYSDVYSNLGDIRSNASANQSDILNRTLSRLLGGGSQRQIGFDAYGRPVYG